MVKAAFSGSLPFVCRSSAAGSPPIPRRLSLPAVRGRVCGLTDCRGRVTPTAGWTVCGRPRTPRRRGWRQQAPASGGGGTLVPAWSVACRPSSSLPRGCWRQPPSQSVRQGRPQECPASCTGPAAARPFARTDGAYRSPTDWQRLRAREGLTSAMRVATSGPALYRVLPSSAIV
jgi:hypothetical protein